MKIVAKFISTIGNPLSLGLFFTFSYYFHVKNISKNPSLVLVAVAALLIPLLSFVIYKVQKGEYTDYDVSNRLKRKQVYQVFMVSLLILMLISIFLRFSNNSIKIQAAVFFQILLSYFINQRLKISMHTSFSFLFAYLFFPINSITAWALFGFGFLNGGSRLLLNRHSPSEVLAGFVLGNTVGLLYLYAINFFL